MKPHLPLLAALVILPLLAAPMRVPAAPAANPAGGAVGLAGPVPVVYSSDLYHPHDDPDDWFDLATLFSMPELDIRGIILDAGRKQLLKPGEIPLKQMMAITGRQVPYAIGLGDNLKGPKDTGADQPQQFQGGVELLLRVLRDAPGPVTLITVGSMRDVAAALNREPELLRAKVGAYYPSAGNGAGVQSEYNAQLDFVAYRRVMESGLPIHWIPCFGERSPGQQGDTLKDGYSSYWRFPQAQLFDRISPKLVAYFAYCLLEMPPGFDPVSAVQSPEWVTLLRPSWRAGTWAGERSMWSTPAFFEAAGLRVYRVGRGAVALSPAEAEVRRRGPDFGGPVYSFEPVQVSFDDQGRITRQPAGPEATMSIFRATDRGAYNYAMELLLVQQLQGLGRGK